MAEFLLSYVVAVSAITVVMRLLRTCLATRGLFSVALLRVALLRVALLRVALLRVALLRVAVWGGSLAWVNCGATEAKVLGCGGVCVCDIGVW